MSIAGTCKSSSVKLREEGNRLYLSVGDGLAPVLRAARLQEAIVKYNQALNCAQNMEEKASALKNIAKTSNKIARALDPEREFCSVKYHISNAIKCFCQSYGNGQNVKSSDWQENVMAGLLGCLEDLEAIADAFHFQKKMAFMEECINALEIDALRAEFCLKIAEMFFHKAVYLLDEKDYRQSLAVIRDCYRPVAEAAKCGRQDPKIMSGVRVMEADLRFHACTAESHQALSIGDDLWKKYCPDKDRKDTTMAWEILDWYKKAVLETREVEVEMEAIAMSRIGKFYDQVFELRSKARENFKKAIQLALSLHPRTFNTEEWYKVCTETLERYQKDQVEQEDEKWNKARKKYIDELEPELKEIAKQAKKGDIDLVTWAYKMHPPKKKEHVIPDDLPDLKKGRLHYNGCMKALLRKAVIHYHPDGCDVATHGEKWKVLCEEICKLLTQRYEAFK